MAKTKNVKEVDGDLMDMDMGNVRKKPQTKEALLKSLKLEDDDLKKLGRFEKTYNKYYNEIDPRSLMTVVQADPTTLMLDEKELDGREVEFLPYTKTISVKADIENPKELKLADEDGMIEKSVTAYLCIFSGVKKVGEYVRWMVTNFIKGTLLQEDLQDSTEMLEMFHRFKQNIKNSDYESDINKYDCLTINTEAHDGKNPLMETIIMFKKPDKSNDENLLISNKYYINNKEATVFFEDTDWLCVIPETAEASAFYGGNTSWCTRAPDQYRNYTSRGKLYIFIDKRKLNTDERRRRLQFHFEDSTYMDIHDSSINLNEFLDEYNWKFYDREKELLQLKLTRNLQNMSDEELKPLIEEKTKDIDEELKLKILNYLLERFKGGADKILLLKDCFPLQKEYLELKFVDTAEFKSAKLKKHFERISNLAKVEKEELLADAFKREMCDYRVLYEHYRKEGPAFVIKNVWNSIKRFNKTVTKQYIKDMETHLNFEEKYKLIIEIIDRFDDDDIKLENNSCYMILDSFSDELKHICTATDEELV